MKIKNINQGKKEIFEEKVIKSKKSGYFKDFNSDHFIEVDSIVNLTKNNNLEEKNKFIFLN